ncbi:MAG: tRNA (adenosine(37)-N6)-threonylcarbamoyltransferase complex ATPase subunit type 1 TsaE [Desulfuromonadaceae bacterium]|nr:tRNA (adenosine(37)-N6)-threonylcarbamoyltransferase complex ATPase subunit type 1 TsaE [Desulfuromonadaceae bacterium]MDD2854736.1 tRNA (adenosine(37)-N6)-threonylcarbamoyltransferase complex ATPase subunit type 1 TsaE [Desulfuromonadaceae bacterium]
MSTLRITTASPAETEELGIFIAALLSPGFFIALRGDLGGGKTCFTRGLVSAIAPQSAHLVSSPTYAIMNSYSAAIPVYHFDFYRLTGDDDVNELGFEEYFYGDGISVVEWSERLTEMLPSDVLTMKFKYLDENRRIISLSSSGENSEKVVDALVKKYNP